MALTVNDFLNDPDFYQLPVNERIKVMNEIDSDNFSKLPPEEQIKVVTVNQPVRESAAPVDNTQSPGASNTPNLSIPSNSQSVQPVVVSKDPTGMVTSPHVVLTTPGQTNNTIMPPNPQLNPAQGQTIPAPNNKYTGLIPGQTPGSMTADEANKAFQPANKINESELAIIKHELTSPLLVDVLYNPRFYEKKPSFQMKVLDKTSPTFNKLPTEVKKKILKSIINMPNIQDIQNMTSEQINAIRNNGPGFLDSLSEELPALGGAIAGSEMGAAYGSAAGPWGTFAGGVIGAAVGALVGETGQQLIEQKAGMRKSINANEILTKGAEYGLYEAGGRAITAGLSKGAEALKARRVAKIEKADREAAPGLQTTIKEREEAAKFLNEYPGKGNKQLTYGETHEGTLKGKVVGGFESILSSISERIPEYKIGRTAKSHKAIIEAAEKIGKSSTPEEVLSLYNENVIDKALKRLHASADTKYKQILKVTNQYNIQVDLTGIKKFAAKRSLTAEKAGKISGAAMADVEMKRVIKLPDNVSYSDAQELLQRIRSKIRSLIRNDKNAPGVRHLKSLEESLKASMNKSLVKNKMDYLVKMSREADQSYQNYITYVRDPVLNTILEDQVKYGDKKALKNFINKKNVKASKTYLEKIRDVDAAENTNKFYIKITGDTDINKATKQLEKTRSGMNLESKVKNVYVSNLMENASNASGELTANKFRKILTNYEDMNKVWLNESERTSIYKLSKVYDTLTKLANKVPLSKTAEGAGYIKFGAMGTIFTGVMTGNTKLVEGGLALLAAPKFIVWVYMKPSTQKLLRIVLDDVLVHTAKGVEKLTMSKAGIGALKVLTNDYKKYEKQQKLSKKESF